MNVRDQAAYLAAGTWHTSRGTVVRLAEMHPAHLVNAFLAALAAKAGQQVTRPLAEAVIARGLAEAAVAEVLRRDGSRK